MDGPGWSKLALSYTGRRVERIQGEGWKGYRQKDEKDTRIRREKVTGKRGRRMERIQCKGFRHRE